MMIIITHIIIILLLLLIIIIINAAVHRSVPTHTGGRSQVGGDLARAAECRAA